MKLVPTNYLIDSHCHIHNTEDFQSTPEEIIARAQCNNVLQMIVIGTSHADSLRARDFAAKYENVFWSYGIHPSEASSFRSDSFAIEGAVAVGEVGLDYHYQPYDRQAQIKLFEEMISLAKKYDLPLIFHIREAFDDFFPIVDNQHITRAVVHSFSDNRENLEESLNRGFYIGVNGLATFADIPLPPLERTLLETDAPYLTPVPNRGKINESGYIKDIANYLAIKMGVSCDKVAEVTTKNARELFQLNRPILRSA